MNTSPTFKVHTYGIALVPMAQWSVGTSAALQPDGKLVLGGYSYTNAGADFSLARLNADGSLDTSFDGDGKLIVSLGVPSRPNDVGTSVALQADGKIVLGGATHGASGDLDVGSSFSVIRLNADGSLDRSFDGDGKAFVQVGALDNCTSIAVQADGKIVLAGFTYVAAGAKADFCVVRLNADGSPDTSFDGDGKAIFPMGSGDDGAMSVVLQPDGKIVLGGTITSDQGSDFCLIRLNANGSLDTSFAGAGKLIVPIGAGVDYGESVVLQPDGKIVFAGFSSVAGSGYDFSLVRLNANGSLDTSFSGDGKATFDVGGQFDYGFSVTLQSDGKILLAGSSSDSLNSDFSVIRLNADGALDTTFGGGDGKVVVPVWRGGDYGHSVTVQPDGKIVLSGTSQNIDRGEFSVVRLNADGSLDSTFNPQVSAGTEGVVNDTEDNDGVVLGASIAVFDAELAALNGGAGNYAGAHLTLSRHGGANPGDVFSLSAFSSLSFSDGLIQLQGKTVGTVVNTGGTLSIQFNEGATQKLVDHLLSRIAYANSSDTPPVSVQLDWTFSDGNTGSQGAGGALTATGSTTVNIVPVNDLPTGRVFIIGNAMPGQTIKAGNTLADADGLGAFSYQWQADGVNIAGATGSSYQVAAADGGKLFSVVISYTDGYGTVERLSSESAVSANFFITENTKAVTTMVPHDVLLGAHPKFTLSGDDADLFRIDSHGVLNFAVAPDFEVSGDMDGDGMYRVSVTMTNTKTHYTVTEAVVVAVNFAAIKGTAADDSLRGTTGRDTLDGLAGNDKLAGRAGVDTFHIGAGSDTISDFNLLGDDSGQEVLQVEAGAKVVATLAADSWSATSDSYNWGVAELRTKGRDVNLSAIADGHGWTVVNTGKSALLIGSMFADVLIAGAGADLLDGDDGDDLLIGNQLADILWGGAGADRFRLNGIKGSTTAHTIADFVSGEDRIELDTKVYKALGVGQVAAAGFVYGTEAQTVNQHLIYDRSTGHLLYDEDGSGKKAAVLIGVLNHDTALSVTDLWGV